MVPIVCGSGDAGGEEGGPVPEWAMVEFQGTLEGMREAAAAAPRDEWEWERGGAVSVGSVQCGATDAATVRTARRARARGRRTERGRRSRRAPASGARFERAGEGRS